MRTEAEPTTLALHFEALDLCDGCGAALTKSEQLSGLCSRCSPPGPPVPTSAKPGRRGKDNHRE